jgi:acyl-CoA:acyl-CoA alkyltransferase
MRWSKVFLAGIGWDLGDDVWTSAAIEDRLAPVYQRIGLHPGRLELMTGIRERRFYSEPIAPSTIAARAGRMAIERSGIDASRIGCVVHASVCRDFLEPATANVVHRSLGLSDGAEVFDLSNACLGVLSAAAIVADRIEMGRIDAGLIVAGENGRPLVESTIAALLADPTIDRKSIKDSIASLTIGSGGAAFLLAREGEHRLIGGVVRSATEHHHLCHGGQNGVALSMSTDSEALLNAGIALARRTWSDFVEATGLSAPDRVITHQVGKAHHHQLLEALGLDRARAFVTYDRLGNVGSVSLPISLGLAAEEGFIRSNDKIALLGIGSGLSSLMMGVEW